MSKMYIHFLSNILFNFLFIFYLLFSKFNFCTDPIWPWENVREPNLTLPDLTWHDQKWPEMTEIWPILTWHYYPWRLS